MIEEIEILQHGECCYLCCHPCEESLRLLCIVSYHHQMVVQLGEHRLDSPTVFPIGPGWRSPVLLVQPVWYFKYDVGRREQVLFHGSTQIAPVAKYHAVMVFPSHVFQITQVMYIGGSHVKRVYDSRSTAQCVKLIAVVVYSLRGTVAPCRGKAHISLSHDTAFGTRILADLYRLGVNTEHKLTAVNGSCYGFADAFTEQAGLFSALVELPAGDEIGNGLGTLAAQTGEKIVLAVDTECFGCEGKCYNLKVGESGNYTTAGNISFVIDFISCILLADFKEFSELCNEVAHNNDFVT